MEQEKYTEEDALIQLEDLSDNNLNVPDRDLLSSVSSETAFTQSTKAGTAFRTFLLIPAEERRTSNVSFMIEEDPMWNEACEKTSTIVSVSNNRNPRPSVFSTTSINSSDFRQTMDKMKLLVVIIIIFLLFVIIYNWFTYQPIREEEFLNKFYDDGTFMQD